MSPVISAHVFFDDAFQGHGDDEFQYTVNDFVKQLVRVMDEAARFVAVFCWSRLITRLVAYEIHVAMKIVKCR